MTIPLTGVIFITATFCGIIALILDYIKKQSLYRQVANVAGPRDLPIIGNAHYFFGNTGEILNKWHTLMDTYLSPFRMWLGKRLLFVIYDAEHIKTILVSPTTIEKDDLYKFAQPFVGTGLFTAPGTTWRIHRKLIAPTFNQRILDSFIEVFSKQSEVLTEQLRKELNKGEFDIFPYVSRATLDIICETAMGVVVKAQTESNSRYVECLNSATEIMALRIFKIWLQIDFIFNLTKLGRELRESINYLNSVTDNVIQKKKSISKNVIQVDNGSVAPERATMKKAFLDLMMELSNDGAKFTDQELRDEVNTMLAAGTDTTASINSFVFLMLANFPEVQEKVYQELYGIYGNKTSSEAPVGKEDLCRMEYMERVIKETMRLFPIGPLIARYVTQDTKIGDYTLPKGSGAVLGIMKLHRYEKYWPDPLKFDPDRFLPEEVSKRHPYSYLPFSGGPRNCLGMTYAMMAMKTLIATTLRRYVIMKDKFVNIKDIELKMDLMLKPVKPLCIKIVERKVAPNINNK